MVRANPSFALALALALSFVSCLLAWLLATSWGCSAGAAGLLSSLIGWPPTRCSWQRRMGDAPRSHFWGLRAAWASEWDGGGRDGVRRAESLWRAMARVHSRTCVCARALRCAGILKLLPGMVAALNRDSSSQGERRDTRVTVTVIARSDDVRLGASVHTERGRVGVRPS